jgi:hypothetical protein
VQFSITGQLSDIETDENHLRLKTPITFTNLEMIIDFNVPFDDEHKLGVIDQISFVSIFPRGISVVYPVSAHWENGGASGSRVRIEWIGACNTDDENHFYKITLPGGRNGITNGCGALLPEDKIFYLEVIKE